MQAGEDRGQQWERVCQDVLGSRAKCERVMEAALEKKQNVIVDRCNFDVSQRQGFSSIARERDAMCAAVVLSLPIHICAQRASQRTEHEGGLTGQKAHSVVRRMAKLIRPPVRRGATITSCKQTCLRGAAFH
jgi:predicted kinase